MVSSSRKRAEQESPYRDILASPQRGDVLNDYIIGFTIILGRRIADARSSVLLVCRTPDDHIPPARPTLITPKDLRKQYFSPTFVACARGRYEVAEKTLSDEQTQSWLSGEMASSILEAPQPGDIFCHPEEFRPRSTHTEVVSVSQNQTVRLKQSKWFRNEWIRSDFDTTQFDMALEDFQKQFAGVVSLRLEEC